ncbi:MAG: hypothetical protein IPO85_11905 [Saprospiraceae bacterium]|uniref:Uncharacterized protein n=1 Tax=Candidatus Defluviibacterium haderslevense TaxID=2981993 RepID=A0A9D7SAE8_9BACT|nr:hypothetical protein [Candidatus Defluviibacterium haderslevense]
MEEKRKVTITYQDIANLESKFTTGAIGGITSNKLIFMNFFIDKVSIPKVVVQEVNEDLSLGEEINSSPSEGIIREIHTSLQFSVEHAKSFIEWINKRIEEINTFEENKINYKMIIDQVAKPSLSYALEKDCKVEGTIRLKDIYNLDPNYFGFTKFMKDLNKINTKLKLEGIRFSLTCPDLVPEFQKLEGKILRFLNFIEPNKMSITLTREKSIYMILYKDSYKILIETYIENDNDEIEGLVTIYENNKIALDKYGKHDFLFKEVTNLVKTPYGLQI